MSREDTQWEPFEQYPLAMEFIVKPKNIRALLGTTGNELPYYERVFVKG